MADLHLYPVQAYPPKITAKDGRELMARPLKREAGCAVCARGRTIVGYMDREARKVWPTCWECARRVADGAAPPPADDFTPYDD